MPISSRPSRAGSGQYAASKDHISQSRPAPAAPEKHFLPQHHRNGIVPNSSDNEDDFDIDGPLAKKRKLSIRHKQTTLDNFTLSSQSGAQTKPPTKVSVAQPHGQLLETLPNGVRVALDVNEDELSDERRALGSGRLLQPAPSIQQHDKVSGPEKKAQDKRTLRSQDEGPRLKSELAIYFPNYEETMFDVDKEDEFITVDTAIYITDDGPKQTQTNYAQTSPQLQKARLGPSPKHVAVNGVAALSAPQKGGAGQYNGSSPVDLDVLSRNLPDTPEDPLTDAHFFKSHRRAERKEKQLRNIERERAMHEKVQLERILDGLQGHDWLKVLGITGITDGEAKKYESKRDFFISEVKFLVDKFKLWKEQERKQRLEREEAARRELEESEDRETEEGSMEPPSSDLNASAARQLQQETVNAVKAPTSSRPSTTNKQQLVQHLTTPKPVQFLPPSPEVPITSFYAKRHLRDAALGKSRHGRNVTAFGHTLPDIEDRDFELPPDYLSEDVLRANAREKRRRIRASIADAASS